MALPEVDARGQRAAPGGRPRRGLPVPPCRGAASAGNAAGLWGLRWWGLRLDSQLDYTACQRLRQEDGRAEDFLYRRGGRPLGGAVGLWGLRWWGLRLDSQLGFQN